LEEELKDLRESELWQAGKTVRSLRPENQSEATQAASHPSTKESFRKQALKSESIR
jgi:ketol-acid reductoisomerase